ncbi:hypothetical protein FC697_06905 [Bacillus wiedmannii]|uniref:S-Ena type endospore appendage n=1 Tax=Bacillus wiedmannii TaxID=1890302 RepID=UPI0010BD53C5|nr:S-Ena type endospore appendage [Bacillus wiedmannii]TKH24981.1 hypothetical protein FC697_06905 [Bacillus wiedmannii]
MKNHSKTRLDKARECLQKRKEDCLPIAFPPCPPLFPPCPPPVKCEEGTMICNNTCGNFLFQDNITSLKIWEKEISKEITITIVVFNSAYSNSSIEVVIGKEIGNPIVFLVPLGGSLSRTVENANFVRITGVNGKRVDGNFCLDICFFK